MLNFNYLFVFWISRFLASLMVFCIFGALSLPEKPTEEFRHNKTLKLPTKQCLFNTILALS